MEQEVEVPPFCVLIFLQKRSILLDYQSPLQYTMCAHPLDLWLARKVGSYARNSRISCYSLQDQNLLFFGNSP
jgi:hypothetical protein